MQTFTPIPSDPVHVRASRPLADVEFCAWVGQAVPGDRLEYHRGFLGIDAMRGISTLPEPERRRVAGLAAAAFRAFEAGFVHLVQARLGPDRFAYLAVARPRPATAPVSAAALLAEEAAA